MSRTAKAVRRNHGNCTCRDLISKVKADEWDHGTCRYMCCFSAKCRTCAGEIWGMGSDACKCEGAPRSVRHTRMAQIVTQVAIKPSVRKRQRGHRN